MTTLSAPGSQTSTITRRSPASVGRPQSRRVLRATVLASMAVVGLVAIAFAVAPLLTEDAYWARILAWRDASFDDYATKFPSRAIPNAAPIYPLQSAPEQLPASFANVTYPTASGVATAPLDTLLESTGTHALLVLRDDSLLVERYASRSSRDATQTSFSVAKSFDSALIGIAINDGAIGSVDDPIVRYLPELAGRGLDGVTIRHLLGMDSGLRYDGTGSGGLPWQDDARSYYDPDLRSLALTVRPAVEPGMRWQYNNYHPLLIGLILERATGRHVADYLSEKLWQPLGMEAPGSWSLDSRHDAFEKMESGVNGRAVDFARFGRLFLKGGAWQGQQVVPRAWVELTTRPNASDLKSDYGLFWRVDTERPGRFYAAGNFGQFIYVAPDRGAVVVRFGDRPGELSYPQWLAVLRGLADAVPPAA